MTAQESTEARLARIEEKIDGLDKRLAERMHGYLGRIEALEASSESTEVGIARIAEKLDSLGALWLQRLDGLAERVNSLEASRMSYGKRIGKLEQAEQHRKGGFAVMAAVWAGAGVLGGLVFKLFPMGN